MESALRECGFSITDERRAQIEFQADDIIAHPQALGVTVAFLDLRNNDKCIIVLWPTQWSERVTVHLNGQDFTVLLDSTFVSAHERGHGEAHRRVAELTPILSSPKEDEEDANSLYHQRVGDDTADAFRLGFTSGSDLEDRLRAQGRATAERTVRQD